MFGYRAELERRAAQFNHYLGLMHDRAHAIIAGPCYMVFSERRHDNSGVSAELHRIKATRAGIILPSIRATTTTGFTAGRFNCAPRRPRQGMAAWRCIGRCIGACASPRLDETLWYFVGVGVAFFGPAWCRSFSAS